MPEPRTDLSIVIVTYNVRDLLAACLKSIYEMEQRCQFDVWVVDNASQDGSLEMLRQYFPQVNLILNELNHGFAFANNQAIQRCTGRYVLLLNPDTIAYRNSFDPLVEFLDKRQKVGAVGSRLLNPDLSLQPSCFPFPTLGRELWRLLHLDVLYPIALYRQQDWSSHEPRHVDVLQGTSLALRREALAEIGLLDEAFFMYSEEVDLCYRLHQAGWHRFWVPASQIIHYGGQSTRQTEEEMFIQLYRAKTIYFRKHHGELAVKIYKVILTFTSMLRIFLNPITRIADPENNPDHARRVGYYHKLIATLSEF